MSQIIAAEDASILIDNTFTITRSSNTITDAISGVTLNLVSENATAASININRDNDKVAEFIGKYYRDPESLMKKIEYGV